MFFINLLTKIVQQYEVVSQITRCILSMMNFLLSRA